jgi:hypothetical protein
MTRSKTTNFLKIRCGCDLRFFAPHQAGGVHRRSSFINRASGFGGKIWAILRVLSRTANAIVATNRRADSPGLTRKTTSDGRMRHGYLSGCCRTIGKPYMIAILAPPGNTGRGRPELQRNQSLLYAGRATNERLSIDCFLNGEAPAMSDLVSGARQRYALRLALCIVFNRQFR